MHFPLKICGMHCGFRILHYFQILAGISCIVICLYSTFKVFLFVCFIDLEYEVLKSLKISEQLYI